MKVLLFYFIAFVNLFLGLFVLAKDPKSRINGSFFIVALGVFFWVLTWAIALSVSDQQVKLFWARMMLAGPALIPSAFLFFALVFPKGKIKISKKVFLLVFVLPPTLLLSVVSTDISVKRLIAPSQGIDFTPGVGNILYIVYFVLYLCAAFFVLGRECYLSKRSERTKIVYVVFGAFVAVLIGVVVNLILPVLGVTKFNSYGPLATTIFIAFTSYAIVKHRLMDISVVISRTAAEAIAIVVYLGLYLVFVYFYQTRISSSIDGAFLAGTVFYGAVVGQTYHRLRLFLQTTADKVFLRGKYDYCGTIALLAANLGKSLSVPHIVQVINRTLREDVEVAESRVLLAPQPFKPKGELVIPCIIEGRLAAYLVLGPKLSEEPYNKTDLELFRSLADHAALAIDQARAYEQIRAELAAAGKELAHTRRLALLGTLSAEITKKILGPLSIARSEIENLTEQSGDQGTLRVFQEKVINNIAGIEKLVQEMLDLARSETTFRA